MIVLGTWQNKNISVSIKPSGLTLSIQDADCSNVFSYDYEGRPWTAMVENVSYRRGLDGKTVAKWIEKNGERGRRWLSSEESETFAEKARETAYGVLQAFQTDALKLESDMPKTAVQGLHSAAGFDKCKRVAEKKRYNQIYLPVGILPPDQYGAVVLQATEGCSFNACTFCNFYRDRPFKIKNEDEFRNHCSDVISFLGNGLSLRRTIFFGDANALVASTSRLIRFFKITNECFDVENLGGIYSFLDGVSGEMKSPSDYSLLSKLGLERVYIGLESGSPNLLRYLNKPSNPGEVLNTVKALKKGGVSVGVIILLGAGGHKYEKEHIRDTIKIINKMSLDINDIIYFSELIESEGMEYMKKAYLDELSPLNEKERIWQSEEIEAKLRFSRSGGTPHISRYDIREFVY